MSRRDMHWIFNATAAQWGAAAAIGTFLVAATAAVVAFLQLKDARRLRWAQAAPYVVVYAEPAPSASSVVELVVKNMGATAASDVSISIEPAPKRAASRGHLAEDVVMPVEFPVLVPGQEWRTMWDSAFQRYESDLPRRHEATVTFTDSRGARSKPSRFVLDWNLIFDRDVITVYGVHEGAAALREINQTLKRWDEGHGQSGIKVFGRDGDVRDQQRRKDFEDRVREQQEGKEPS